MPFNGIINQLTTLTAALDAFCKTAAIEHGTDEFDEARYLILSLYRNGATSVEALKTALENRLLRDIERLSPVGKTTDKAGDVFGTWPRGDPPVVVHERHLAGYAVPSDSFDGMTAFPFSLAQRMVAGRPRVEGAQPATCHPRWRNAT